LQLYYIMAEKSALWYTFYLAIAVLGLQYYYFISLQLLDLLNRSEALANVIKAVTRPAKELGLTALLLFFIIYIFSIFSLYFLAPLWGDGSSRTNCRSSLTCFLTALDQGLLNGGGLGDMMQRVDINSQLWVPELVFILAYFFIIIIIGLNIVFGIIIDTFGSLREEYNEKLNDMRSVCFICGLEAEVFEKYSEGFKVHIKGSHSMWNYLFYMIYIQEKDPNERNGPEDFVADCIEEQVIDFFPVRRSLELKGKGVEGQDDVVGGGEDGASATDKSFDAIMGKLDKLEGLQAQMDGLKAMLAKLLSEKK